MQATHHTSGDFHRHLVLTVRTTNTQPHIMAAQPVVRRFVIDVEQLYRGVMFTGELMKVGSQRINAVIFDDKF
ncbi:hypothetical protein D3C78_1703820 [compost metagenome]